MAFFYPWYPGCYARDTADLKPMEDLYYRRLLDSYYSTGSIPSDYYRLYSICKATNLRDRASVKYVADRFFHKELGWHVDSETGISGTTKNQGKIRRSKGFSQ